MIEITKSIKIKILAFTELTKEQQKLMEYAVAVRHNAQAPYSNYYVGASLVTDNRLFFSGCNVERVSYTQTTHAEQNAIDSAIATCGKIKISSLAVVGGPIGQRITLLDGPQISKDLLSDKKIMTAIENVCPSCGHCLQCIAENCFNWNGSFDPNVALIGKIKIPEYENLFYQTTIGDALPMPFLPYRIKKIAT